MWTCSKCGGNVGDQFTTCQSCGTNADGIAAPPAVGIIDETPGLHGVASPAPEPQPVSPPALGQRLARAAKAGAIYGALYGAGYCLIFWIGMAMLLQGNVSFPHGPAAALGLAMVKGGLAGAIIGVPVAVLFRLVFPYKPPKSKS